MPSALGTSTPATILLAPVIIPLLFLSPLTAVAAALGSAASIAMAAMMNIWWQRPGKRAEVPEELAVDVQLSLVPEGHGCSDRCGPDVHAEGAER